MQNWGGGEEFLLSLHNYVTYFNFIIITPEGDAEIKFRENGINTIINNQQKKVYRKSGWNLISVLKIILGVKLSSIKFLFQLNREKYDLVLANGLFAALYVLPSVFLSGKKLIVVQHLIFEDDSVEKKIIKLVNWFACKIVCVSYAVNNNLKSFLSDQSKLLVIPNGIRVKEMHLPEGNNSSIIRIGMVGGIIRIKGIDLVIKAINEFLKRNHISFHIFGKTSNDEDSENFKTELINYIEMNGLTNKIIFEGQVDSKEIIYSGVDLVINYSIIPEAFPFSVLEAMAHKKIVIAADAGGPKEIIEDSVNGFLVEPNNVNRLKNKIEFCINNFNSNDFQQIRENAFITVKEKYSIDKFSSAYSDLFHSLTQS